MAVFAVTYDLRAPGRNYTRLYDRLSAWRAVHALESVWLVNADATAAAIRNDLKGYIDANDRLFVAKLAGESAWSAIMPGADELIWSQFGRAA